jgi:hypothetical protein
LANTLYRKIYVAHLRTIYEDYLAGGELEKRARAIHAMIAPHVEEDEGKLYSYSAFEENFAGTSHIDGDSIIGIMELMNKRGAYLQAHPLLQREPPVIEDIQHEKAGQDLRISVRVRGAEKVWLYQRQAGKGNFRRQEMTVDGGYSEQGREEVDWIATLPNEKGTEYYLVAEGEQAAALSPARASREFHRVE